MEKLIKSNQSVPFAIIALYMAEVQLFFCVFSIFTIRFRDRKFLNEIAWKLKRAENGKTAGHFITNEECKTNR